MLLLDANLGTDSLVSHRRTSKEDHELTLAGN